jgi:molybdopterin-guanine dinucleotide biosynthesis protein A
MSNRNDLKLTEKAAGFVLAGGRSSRMGAEKALKLLRGEPLVVRALRTLREAGELLPAIKISGFPVAIAGARIPLDAFAPVVPDAEPDRGPLGGVCAALRATEARWAVFLSVDQPLIPPALLAFLLQKSMEDNALVALASFEGFAQSFPVVVDRVALPVLQAELEAGRAGCFAAFQTAAAALGRPLTVFPAVELWEQGSVRHPQQLAPREWFLNLNRLEDLQRAEQLLENAAR